MGFFKTLLGIGATAGATVAVMKVAERYKQNQQACAGDCNGDGNTNFNDTVSGVAKAAGEVYAEAAVKAKDMAATVKEKAPELVNKAKNAASDVLDSIKGGARTAYAEPSSCSQDDPDCGGTQA